MKKDPTRGSLFDRLLGGFYDICVGCVVLMGLPVLWLGWQVLDRDSPPCAWVFLVAAFVVGYRYMLKIGNDN